MEVGESVYIVCVGGGGKSSCIYICLMCIRNIISSGGGGCVWV